MIRKLIDFKKLDPQLTNLLLKDYPHGYGDNDIISFKNAKGENIEAVEVKTPSIVYLVKLSKSLSSFIDDFDATVEKELASNEFLAKDLNEHKLDVT